MAASKGPLSHSLHIVAFAVAFGWAVPSRADEDGAHHEEYPNLVGARTGLLGVFEREDGETEALPGLLVGVSYERVVVHEWLELEISVPVATLARGEPTLFMPMDLHAKLPFHPDPRVSPYLAIGPALDLLLRPDVELVVGSSVAVGTYVWASDRIGLDFEIDYNLVFEESPVHELLFAMGPVYRF